MMLVDLVQSVLRPQKYARLDDNAKKCQLIFVCRAQYPGLLRGLHCPVLHLGKCEGLPCDQGIYCCTALPAEDGSNRVVSKSPNTLKQLETSYAAVHIKPLVVAVVVFGSRVLT